MSEITFINSHLDNAEEHVHSANVQHVSHDVWQSWLKSLIRLVNYTVELGQHIAPVYLNSFAIPLHFHPKRLPAASR